MEYTVIVNHATLTPYFVELIKDARIICDYSQITEDYFQVFNLEKWDVEWIVKKIKEMGFTSVEIYKQIGLNLEKCVPSKRYQPVYIHKNGGEIGMVQSWFPTREMAEKVLERKREHFYKLLEYKPEMHIAERDYFTTLDECREFEGKKVYNEDWWFYDAADIGDFVEEEIAEYAGNCVPPKHYTRNYIQCGEPHSSKFDEEKDKWRSTYATFVKVADGIWKWCGNCFVGETEERGKEMAWV